MINRKRHHGALYPPQWITADTYAHGRKTITRGTPLKIKGQRGTYQFWDHVINPPAGRRRTPREWITVTGPDGVGQFRAFRPDKISRVMRGRTRNKTR